MLVRVLGVCELEELLQGWQRCGGIPIFSTQQWPRERSHVWRNSSAVLPLNANPVCCSPAGRNPNVSKGFYLTLSSQDTGVVRHNLPSKCSTAHMPNAQAWPSLCTYVVHQMGKNTALCVGCQTRPWSTKLLAIAPATEAAAAAAAAATSFCSVNCAAPPILPFPCNGDRANTIRFAAAASASG